MDKRLSNGLGHAISHGGLCRPKPRNEVENAVCDGAAYQGRRHRRKNRGCRGPVKIDAIDCAYLYGQGKVRGGHGVVHAGNPGDAGKADRGAFGVRYRSGKASTGRGAGGAIVQSALRWRLPVGVDAYGDRCRGIIPFPERCLSPVLAGKKQYGTIHHSGAPGNGQLGAVFRSLLLGVVCRDRTAVARRQPGDRGRA